jgi:hypothetical protein
MKKVSHWSQHVFDMPKLLVSLLTKLRSSEILYFCLLEFVSLSLENGRLRCTEVADTTMLGTDRIHYAPIITIVSFTAGKLPQVPDAVRCSHWHNS